MFNEDEFMSNWETRIDRFVAPQVLAFDGVDISTLTRTEKYLANRNYSPKGWQYHRYGNSSEVTILIHTLHANGEKIYDKSRGAKNDHNFGSDLNMLYKLEDAYVYFTGSTNRKGTNLSGTLYTYKQSHRPEEVVKYTDFGTIY